MHHRQFWFACGVAVLALLAGVVVALLAPHLPPNGVTAVVVLACLAMVAELLAFLIPHGARGSIAFIPYLASMLIAPHWAALVSIVFVSALTQLSRRARLSDLIFNVAQHALTLAIAVLVYHGLGGKSFLLGPHATLIGLTQTAGPAAIAAYAVSFAVNTTIVSAFISVKNGGSTLSVWRELHLSTIGIDLLASPIVFVFAWLYTTHGAFAAALAFVPIVGLRQVHKTNLELDQTNQELLELMVKSIEARDPYTSGHSRRVRHYSTTIARALGLREREVTLVSKAALLHDVGKLHEKYGQILTKADRLTPSEWATMQEHPGDGATLVATMSRLHDVVASIRHHHENWDGSGY